MPADVRARMVAALTMYDTWQRESTEALRYVTYHYGYNWKDVREAGVEAPDAGPAAREAR